jgi:hypothetical protein
LSRLLCHEWTSVLPVSPAVVTATKCQ